VRRSDVAITGTDEMDLRELVTVFVTTVGYPTFERCLEHLRAQDSRFTLRIIDHVAPMSAAFQRMLDECTTPYYVQVDEDMLLYPHAVRTLYERLVAMESRKVQYVAALYDVHLNRIIYGLKIFRHTVVRRYPFRDVAGCEWDQIRRLRADGYVDVRIPLEGATRYSEQTLGLHGTYWTTEAVYLRYFVLELTRRMGNRTHEWLSDTATMFLQRFLKTRSEVDFHALMGILAGALTEPTTMGGEKDYRTYDRTPGLEGLRRFVEEVRHAWRHGPALAPGYDIDVLRDDARRDTPS
jgi:hypothetical protein